MMRRNRHARLPWLVLAALLVIVGASAWHASRHAPRRPLLTERTTPRRAFIGTGTGVAPANRINRAAAPPPASGPAVSQPSPGRFNAPAPFVAPSPDAGPDAFWEVRAIADEWVQGRRNLFFRQSEFIDEALGRDEALVAHSLAYLLDPAALIELARNEEADEETVRQRMGAIDVLEGVGRAAEDLRERRAAREALSTLCDPALSAALPRRARALARADAADALAALTRLDPARGLARWRSLAAEVQQPLRATVAGALMDLGRSRNDVLRMVGDEAAG